MKYNLTTILTKNVSKQELIPAGKEMERGDAICLESNHVFFHKVVGQSACPHDLKFFCLSTQNMK